MSTGARTVIGTVQFIWDGDGRLLLTMEPDDPGDPHTFEVAGELRERITDAISEGDRVEIEYVPVEHEIVDPDHGPSDTYRAEVREVRP